MINIGTNLLLLSNALAVTISTIAMFTINISYILSYYKSL